MSAPVINSVVKLGTNLYQIVGTGSPLDGLSGTQVGIAGPGSTYFDDATGRKYVNSYLITSPTWSLILNVTTGITENQVASAATTGLGLVRYAKATYDFTVDGGGVSTITPVSGATLPINSIILGGIIDTVIPLTSGGSATVAIGTSAGSSAASLKAALAFGSYTGLVAVIPLFTAVTMIKMTAAGNITFTIATAALTAGKLNVILAYVVGN